MIKKTGDQMFFNGYYFIWKNEASLHILFSTVSFETFYITQSSANTV